MGLGKCADFSLGHFAVFKQHERWNTANTELSRGVGIFIDVELRETDVGPLGSELFKEGRYGEARDHLQRAVENKPDYSVAYRMLGRAHYELHEDAEALTEKIADLQVRLEKRVGERRKDPRRS